jgi:hypothetical protein
MVPTPDYVVRRECDLTLSAIGAWGRQADDQEA